MRSCRPFLVLSSFRDPGPSSVVKEARASVYDRIQCAPPFSLLENIVEAPPSRVFHIPVLVYNAAINFMPPRGRQEGEGERERGGEGGEGGKGREKESCCNETNLLFLLKNSNNASGPARINNQIVALVPAPPWAHRGIKVRGITCNPEIITR